MILRRNETGHLDRVFNLTYESVDIVADRIQHFLAYIKMEKNTMLRVRLSVEEVLLRWHTLRAAKGHLLLITCRLPLTSPSNIP